MSAKYSYEVNLKDMSAIFGDGSPKDPMRFFEDKYHRFATESYGPKGEWYGWKVEDLEPKEYFKRKLAGK